LHLFAAHIHSTRGIDLLHGNLVARLVLCAARGVSPSERDNRTDLDSLGNPSGGKPKKRERY
jgi:hypothetical protein